MPNLHFLGDFLYVLYNHLYKITPKKMFQLVLNGFIIYLKMREFKDKKSMRKNIHNICLA